MNQIGPRREKICSEQEIFDRQMKGRTGGQTDHYMAPPKKIDWGTILRLQTDGQKDRRTVDSNLPPPLLPPKLFWRGYNILKSSVQINLMK